MDLTELGAVVVNVVPSFKGISGAMASSAKQAADDWSNVFALTTGQRFEEVGRSAATALSSGLRDGATELERVTAAMGASLAAHEEALRRVASEQRVLNEMRASGNYLNTTLQVAEDRLTSARRSAAEALVAHKKAQVDYNDALAHGAKEADEAAKSLRRAEEAGTAVGAAISSTAGIAVAGFAAVGAATLAVGTALLDVGEKWESVEREIRVHSTSMGRDFEGLEETVRVVAGNTSASLTSVADATATLAQKTGLRGGALQELVTDFSDASKLLGKPVDVAPFVASIRALGIPMQQADQWLNQLFNLSRQTGMPLNELMSAVSKNAVAFHQFNIPAGAAATLIAEFSENGIAATATTRGLTSAAKEATKEHRNFGDFLKATVAQLVHFKETGNDPAFNKVAERVFGSKGAIAFKQAIDQGILSVESLGEVLDIPSDKISDLFEKSKTLSDEFAIFRNIIDSALAPIGLAISKNIGGGLEHINGWLKTHGDVILTWFKDIFNGAITAGEGLIKAFQPLVEFLGKAEVAYGNLFHDDAIKQSGLDLENWAKKLTQPDGVIDGLEKAKKKGDDWLDGIKATTAVNELLNDSLKKTADGKGFQIKDNSKEVQEDLKRLKDYGVEVTQGPDGKLNFRVDTPENKQRVEDFIKGVSDKEITVTVVPRTPEGAEPRPTSPRPTSPHHDAPHRGAPAPKPHDPKDLKGPSRSPDVLPPPSRWIPDILDLLRGKPDSPVPPGLHPPGHPELAITGQTGFTVPGSGSGDIVPAMLEPGEEIIRKTQAQKYRPLLKAINAGTQGFSTGGEAGRAWFSGGSSAPEGPTSIMIAKHFEHFQGGGTADDSPGWPFSPPTPGVPTPPGGWMSKREHANTEWEERQTEAARTVEHQEDRIEDLTNTIDDYNDKLKDLTDQLSDETLTEDDRKKLTKELNRTQQQLNRSTRDLGEAQDDLTTDERKQAEAARTPPSGAGSGGDNDIGSDFGKGIVKGVGEALGFGDLGSVFGKGIFQWGLTKLATGAIGDILRTFAAGQGYSDSGGSSGGGVGRGLSHGIMDALGLKPGFLLPPEMRQHGQQGQQGESPQAGGASFPHPTRLAPGFLDQAQQSMQQLPMIGGGAQGAPAPPPSGAPPASASPGEVPKPVAPGPAAPAIPAPPPGFLPPRAAPGSGGPFSMLPGSNIPAPPAGAKPSGYSGGKLGTARAIVQAAAARGYSPDQIKAILSTGLQESGLDEGVRGGGGAWHGIFQQDTSYPNRDDAQGNIDAFLDRLGPPKQGDFYKQIFGLQQGTPYGSSGARNNYLNEIQSHQAEADDLYNQVTGDSGGSTPVQSASYSPGVPAIQSTAFATSPSGGDYGAAAGKPTINPPDENTLRSWVQEKFGIPNTFGTGSWENTAHEDDGKWHHPSAALRGAAYTGPLLPSGDAKFGYGFDFHGTDAQMDALSHWVHDNYAAQTLELIHQGPNFDPSLEIDNGKPYNFGPALNAQHGGGPGGHVHWAMTVAPYAAGSGIGDIPDINQMVTPGAAGTPHYGSGQLPGPAASSTGSMAGMALGAVGALGGMALGAIGQQSADAYRVSNHMNDASPQNSATQAQMDREFSDAWTRSSQRNWQASAPAPASSVADAVVRARQPVPTVTQPPVSNISFVNNNSGIMNPPDVDKRLQQTIINANRGYAGGAPVLV